MKVDRRLSLVSAVLLASLLAGLPAPGGTPELKQLGAWPGYARGEAADVCVQSNYAYMAIGEGGLMILNVSNPTNVTRVGGYNSPGSAKAVKVKGSYAYLSDDNLGLAVIDVSNPGNPMLVGSNNDVAGSLNDVWVDGEKAFIAGESTTLAVYDISTPTNPVLLGTTNTGAAAYGVCVTGQYAYVATWQSGLQIFDLAVPSHPALVGQTNVGYGRAVQVQNGNAYVGCRDSFCIVSVTNVSNPYVLSSRTSSSIVDVRVAGNYAYVAESYGTVLGVIDISIATNPVLAGSYIAVPGSSYGIDLNGRYAYIADRLNGLQVIDINSPGSPVPTGGYICCGYASGIQVQGNYAYLTDKANGVQVFDVSRGNRPLHVGGTNLALPVPGAEPYYANNLCVTGRYAYVAANEVMAVVDITNPAAPVVVGMTNLQNTLQDIAVKGSYAYLAGYSDRALIVVDISTPTNPVLAAKTAALPSRVYAVAVYGNYAYVGAQDGLKVYDISNPLIPSLVASTNSTHSHYGLQVHGQHLYAANGNRYVDVYSLTNPALPALIGNITGGPYGLGNGVYVDGSLAYVASGAYGLAVDDVSSPASASNLYTVVTGGHAENVFVSGGKAYVADGEEGLKILGFPGGLPWLSLLTGN